MQELIILIILAILTLTLKIKFKEVLYHSEKERISVSLLILFIMISWEHFSVTRNIWIYPGDGLLGYYIWSLPVELYVFYLILPYFVFLVFDLVHKREEKQLNMHN